MQNIKESVKAATPEVTPQPTEQYPAPVRDVFTETLSNGKVIKAREMTGGQYIYMETKLKKEPSGLRRIFHMLSHLMIEPNSIPLAEMESLPAKDVVKLSKLFSYCAGESVEEEVEEDDDLEDMEFPN